MKEFLKVPQPTEMLRMLHKNEVSVERLEGIYGKRNEKYPRRSKHRVYVCGIGPVLQKRRNKNRSFKALRSERLEAERSERDAQSGFWSILAIFNLFDIAGSCGCTPIVEYEKLRQSTCLKTVPGGVKRLTLAVNCFFHLSPSVRLSIFVQGFCVWTVRDYVRARDITFWLLSRIFHTSGTCTESCEVDFGVYKLTSCLEWSIAPLSRTLFAPIRI